MRDWWEFIFSSFWVWLGTVILFLCVVEVLGNVVSCLRQKDKP